MLTNQQIELIRNSWSKVVPISKVAGIMFYDRLFEVAPSVKPLFKSPLSEQSVKLMSMLGMVVGHLDKLDVISSQVAQLAQRHNAYGAKPEHYTVVGECLIWTLEQGLGDDFDSATKEAWLAAFTALSGIMIDAQRQSAVA
ncbi:MAG: globin domain-containing protein [Bacteroidota bacterium]|nr:globin domain-containing protein [Bacteroidota bacterium]MDX5430611.1 globin domain-containing protein [Bacteroidota bacterium]MDX5469363.1 globin domain-containing protein [Bacteroidota bacterium]